ncbi:MAG: nucleotidyltransferase domain-containing protein, partial [Candidatus Korarchaeum sp.]
MRRKYSSSVRVFFPKLSQEDVIREVSRVVSLLSESLALKKVVIFGSYAKKRYTAGSDIDLLVVFDDTQCEEDDVYKNPMKNIKLPRLELHILSLKEYEEMRNSK